MVWDGRSDGSIDDGSRDKAGIVRFRNLSMWIGNFFFWGGGECSRGAPHWNQWDFAAYRGPFFAAPSHHFRSLGFPDTLLGPPFFFTARRYAKRGICRRRVSVRPSVCLSVCLFVCVCACVSVTLRYCIKTAKRRITQIMLHDSPVTSFFDTKVHAKFERDHPLLGRQMQVSWVKIRHFRKRYKIGL